MGFGVPHLYRSTDGGSTWNNVTANLPNAPANAVAIDPNSASVAYVATDTGVYVATDVASCATVGSQCWSAYGTALPNAPVVSLVASAGVTVPGALAAGALRAGTYGRGMWQIPLVTGGQIASASATLTPSSLQFPGEAVNTTSAPEMTTLTNSGNVPLTVASASVTAQFAEMDTCAGTTLAPGATCSMQITFSPLSAGVQVGTLTVLANVPGGYVTASLSGTGTAASAVSLGPATELFPATAVGATSVPQTITVTNNGTAASSLQQASIRGDFAIRSNSCLGSLPAGASCVLTVTFTPTAAGARAGTVSILDADGNHTVALSGIGVAGRLAASPTALAFPDTSLNATSGVRTVTVSNAGTAPLAISAVSAAGDFHETDNCAGSALPPGAACAIQVTFMPTATGVRAGTLTLVSNAGGADGAVSTVSLAGNGTGAFNIVLTPQSLTFPPVLVGSASAVQNVTISNTGIQTGSLGAITVTSDFVLRANTCGASLPPQTGCTVSVIFTPVAGGARTGVLSVSDDAGTQTAPLAGTGTLPATDILSPSSLSFLTQQVGTTSAGQQVLLTNDGDVPLTLISAQIGSGDFIAANACGPTLAPHSACGITVTFSPKSTGALSGSLVVTDVQRVQTIALTGVAIAGPGVSLTPATLDFGNTGVGNASAAQTATLTNNGGSPLTISALTVQGDFGILAGSNTCPTTTPLPVGSACTVAIAFAPASSGARAGSLTLTSNAAPQVVHLNGTGVDFSLALNGPASQSVTNGMSAIFPLLMRPAVATAETVSYTCTGAPANSICNVVSQYPDLSAVSTVTVTLATGVSTATSFVLPQKAWVLAGLLPWLALGFRTRRRGWPARLMLLWCAVTLGSVLGCGAGRQLPQLGNASSGASGPAAVTPSGTYSLVVTATGAGLTRQVPLALTVR